MVPPRSSCGGWAHPRPISIAETASDRYPVRTEWNVRDSQGTLILHVGRVDRGTALTESLARRYGRPLLRLDLREARPEELRRWMVDHGVAVLNIAGPRESRAPGIQALARSFLEAALQPLAAQRSRSQ